MPFFVSSLLSGFALLAAVWLLIDGSNRVPTATTGAIAIAPAVAAPPPPDTAPTPIVRRVARKGTRNYNPGDSDAQTVPSTTPSDETAADRDPLKECMGTWDAATHISKSKWREICERQIKQRADTRREFEAQIPTAP